MNYLESLIPDTAEAEISKEIISQINFQQVKKILREQEYDFKNSKNISLILKSPSKSEIGYNMTLNSFKHNNWRMNKSGPFKFGSNIENYFLYKNLNKTNISSQSLYPVTESKIFGLFCSFTEGIEELPFRK